MGIIYCITSPSGKQYIGQTIRTLSERWRDHCRSKSVCPAVHNAIVKYGEENMLVEIIDEADSVEELNQKEMFWIEELDTLSPRGYNLKTGGANCKMSEETKAKMRASAAKRPPMAEETKAKIKAAKEGEKNPFYGKAHTDDTKARMRSHQPHKRRVRCVESGTIYASLADARRDTGVRSEDISRVCSGKRKIAGGLHWEYAQ